MLLPTDLLGGWRLDRLIDDRLSGQRRLVVGTSRLEPDGADVRWTEEGTMRWPGGESPVARTLLVTAEADGGWMVRFADRRGFHAWSPGRQVEHECAPDLYRGSITGDRDAWTVVWEARGPAKDYRIESRLTR